MRHLMARLTSSRGAPVPLLLALVTAGAPFAAAVAQDATARPKASPPAVAEPNWKTSPYHGVIDGDGNVIPCRCLYRGRQFQLGEKVCMETYRGTVMAECDMQLNNTSWVPTTEACTIS